MLLHLVTTEISLLLLLVRAAVISAFPEPSATKGSPLPAKVSTVYQFPTGTWLENLEQRRSGEILTTELFTPRLWQVNPREPPSQQPVLVTTISDKSGLFGITEFSPDIFAVVAGNFTETGDIVRGSFSVYRVDLNHNPAATSRLVDIPGGQLLNGITYIPNSVLKRYSKGVLLVTDTFLGVIWSIDLATFQARIWAKDPLMAVCPPATLGINGIKYNNADKKVYFSNSQCQGGYLASLPLDTRTGTPAGPAVLVGGKSQFVPTDDFDLDQKNRLAYVSASTMDQIDTIDLVSGKTRVIAGNINSSQIAQGTSVKLGRTAGDKRKGLFYVSTAGLYGDSVTGGQIIAIRR